MHNIHHLSTRMTRVPKVLFYFILFHFNIYNQQFQSMHSRSPQITKLGLHVCQTNLMELSVPSLFLPSQPVLVRNTFHIFKVSADTYSLLTAHSITIHLQMEQYYLNSYFICLRYRWHYINKYTSYRLSAVYNTHTYRFYSIHASFQVQY